MVKRPRPFTVEEFHRLAEAGILREDDRVELIRGEILEMSPIGSRHAAAVNRLARLLIQALENQAIVSIQNPVQLGKDSEPEPDLVLLKPRADEYAHALPQAGDVLLLVEVADTSLAYDLEVKLPLYAQHGIPEVWVVDLLRERVLVFRHPQGESYGETLTEGPEGSLTPLLLPEVSFPARLVLLKP